MNNKINVTICSRPYTLIPGDEHTQVEQIAAKVDQAMNAVLGSLTVT
jgi:cell division protein ZapA (FtsZ GTPase activity inhibitor)